MRAWEAWHHCTGNTYGTWLPGDPRGWSTRHNRDEGAFDLRSPPDPDTRERIFQRSMSLMKREPVRLCANGRRVACDVMAESLRRDGVELVALCVDDHHFHVLGRFPDISPRHAVGKAKRRSARALAVQGLVQPGGVWSVRFRVGAIEDREHALSTHDYIIAHAERGAAVLQTQNPWT